MSLEISTLPDAADSQVERAVRKKMIRRICEALDLTYFMRRGYLVVASIQFIAESSWPICSLKLCRIVR